jgi:hypothetical protein
MELKFKLVVQLSGYVETWLQGDTLNIQYISWYIYIYKQLP